MVGRDPHQDGRAATNRLIVVALAPALAIVADEVIGSERRRRALELLEALVSAPCAGR